MLGVAFLKVLREPSTDREPSPEDALHWTFAKGPGPPPWGRAQSPRFEHAHSRPYRKIPLPAGVPTLSSGARRPVTPR
jgi:hypothetical protein